MAGIQLQTRHCLASQVWIKDWGVHIQPAGSGAARTAISDGRIFAVDQRGVTFRWKDRSDHNRSKVTTLTGSEFVRRYLGSFDERGNKVR